MLLLLLLLPARACVRAAGTPTSRPRRCRQRGRRRPWLYARIGRCWWRQHSGAPAGRGGRSVRWGVDLAGERRCEVCWGRGAVRRVGSAERGVAHHWTSGERAGDAGRNSFGHNTGHRPTHFGPTCLAGSPVTCLLCGPKPMMPLPTPLILQPCERPTSNTAGSSPGGGVLCVPRPAARGCMRSSACLTHRMCTPYVVTHLSVVPHDALPAGRQAQSDAAHQGGRRSLRYGTAREGAGSSSGTLTADARVVCGPAGGGRQQLRQAVP